MSVTRVRWLAAIAVACTLVTWLALRRLYASLPPLPWTPVPTLLLLAIVEAWSGRVLQARIGGRRPGQAGGDRQPGPPGRPLPPLAVTRAVAIAKASANAAAVIGGVAAGFVIHLAPSLNRATPHGDALVALVTLAAAVALAAGALYLERSCRVPRRPGGDESGRAGPRPSAR